MVHLDEVINRHFKVLVFAVLVLALTMRLLSIEKYPVSLSMDEVAIGYNAYSILNTGKDEFRESFPLAFRSAGDYKPPVNIYLAVPSIYLFGLTEFAVRLPVALIGSLTAVVLIFFLRSLGLSRVGSLFGGFWLSVLPWHIHFSRGSFEAITALFFLLLGSWLFILWTKSKKALILAGSVASFSLSVWAYHAERLFTPLVALFLFFLFKDRIELAKIKIKKQFLVAGIVLAIFATPFLKLTFFTEAISQRAASTSILREASLGNALHLGSYENLGERIFDNDFYLIFIHWLGKYLNYYDLRFWFWKGLAFTPPGYPDLGLLLAVDLPLFFLGVYALIKSKNEKLKGLALFWFFVGPLPASLTMNEQHPLRALVWIPFFAIVLGHGFDYLTKKVKSWGVFLYLAILCLNFIYLADIYIHHFPRYYSEYWQYGYKEVATYACENRDKYDNIVITDTFGGYGPLNTGLPYLYVLFYCDWDREIFLKTGGHSEKILFRRPNFEDFLKPEKMLLIGSPWDFLDELEKKGKDVYRLDYPNGKGAFIFKENR